jgi:catalase
LTSTASVCFDALFICSGEDSVKELMIPENKHLVLHFINEAYKHCKAIYFGADTEPFIITVMLLQKNMKIRQSLPGKIKPMDKFINAIAQHRVWDLEMEETRNHKIKHPSHQSH